MQRIIAAAVLVASTGLAGCTNATVKKVNSVQVVTANEELSEAALLDVGLAVFDPGVDVSAPIDPDESIYPEVRKAEGRYVPWVLRETMERSNQWGAVRMLPEVDPASEVQISGEILHSDGVILEVRVRAVDATGREWLDKRYEDVATQFAYRDDVEYNGDAFQDLYNQITNDLLRIRQKLTADELREIRTVASLKYAAELAPQSFGDHLGVDNRSGRVVINRLPAQRDPMLARVNRIRDSEYLFVDTMDQQFNVFYNQMDPSYDQWRRYSYEETLAMQDVKRSARTRALAGLLGVVGGAAVSSKSKGNSAVNTLGSAAALGGLYALKQSYDTYQEAKIHEEALKELAASFDAEVKPIVVEVEGEVVKLNGTLQAQYREWRRLLREIYQAETGMPVADTVPQ